MDIINKYEIWAERCKLVGRLFLIASTVNWAIACESKFSVEESSDSRGTSVEAGTDSIETSSKLGNSDCVDPDLSLVAKSQSMMLCDGTLAKGALDLTNLVAGNVKSGVTIGAISGTLTSNGPADCASDGEVACVTTASHRAATIAGLAAKVLTGQTVAGEPGGHTPDFPAAANVRSNDTVNGVTGLIGNCIALGSACYVPTYVNATQPLKAISFDSITAGIIKKNSVIAGITGDYPSVTHVLTGADGTADLSDNAGVMDSQLKSATAFEWFLSDGTRATSSGDADIVAGNIVSTATIFGTTGNVTAPSTPDAWNIRIGQTINGVTGKLKVGCRNTANSSLWDIGVMQDATADNSTDFLTVTAHGYSDNDTVGLTGQTVATGLNFSTTYYVRNSTANTFQVAATSGGAAINFTTDGASLNVYKIGDGTRDIWDTIEDYNNNLSVMTSANVPAAWSSDYFCGGVGTASGSEVWTDTTTDGACDNAADDCRFKDKITNLEWSEIISTSTRWGRAMTACANMSFGGAGTWRLPTQKELMAAYEHGIYSAATANWITKAEMNSYFWSSSTASTLLSSNAWYITFSNGYTSNPGKSNGYQVVCVR